MAPFIERPPPPYCMCWPFTFSSLYMMHKLWGTWTIHHLCVKSPWACTLKNRPISISLPWKLKRLTFRTMWTSLHVFTCIVVVPHTVIRMCGSRLTYKPHVAHRVWAVQSWGRPWSTCDMWKLLSDGPVFCFLPILHKSVLFIQLHHPLRVYDDCSCCRGFWRGTGWKHGMFHTC